MPQGPCSIKFALLEVKSSSQGPVAHLIVLDAFSHSLGGWPQVVLDPASNPQGCQIDDGVFGVQTRGRGLVAPLGHGGVQESLQSVRRAADMVLSLLNSSQSDVLLARIAEPG